MSLNAPLLRESLALAVEREGLVTRRFYELLFARYPQVRPLFSREPARQQKMLQDSLLAVLDHLDDGEWLSETLGNMGQVHAESYQVEREMYPWVGECLVAALAEACGDDWTPAHAGAWGEAFQAVSSLMLAGAARVVR